GGPDGLALMQVSQGLRVVAGCHCDRVGSAAGDDGAQGGGCGCGTADDVPGPELASASTRRGYLPAGDQDGQRQHGQEKKQPEGVPQGVQHVVRVDSGAVLASKWFVGEP